jgi:hypothetical protein
LQDVAFWPMLSKKSPFLLVIAWIALGGETWSRFWLLVVA